MILSFLMFTCFADVTQLRAEHLKKQEQYARELKVHEEKTEQIFKNMEAVEKQIAELEEKLTNTSTDLQTKEKLVAEAERKIQNQRKAITGMGPNLKKQEENLAKQKEELQKARHIHAATEAAHQAVKGHLKKHGTELEQHQEKHPMLMLKK